MPYQEIRRAASARPTSALRVVAPVIAVVLCFCVICIDVLNEAGRAAWDRSGDNSASLVAAIESDIIRNVEALNLSLQGAVDTLKRPDIDRIDPELRQLALFDHSATAERFGAILVLDKKGRLRFDSRNTTSRPLDLSDRDYFKAHQKERAPILYVGQPQASRSTGAFIVGISRRLSNPDGSFAGVVAGTIQLNYFKTLFNAINLGPGSNITLAHSDGTILMKWPFTPDVIGKNISHAGLYKQLAQSRSGRFETTGVIDGMHGLVAYSQVSDLPIVIAVGQASDVIYAQWRKYAWIVGLLVATLCALSAMFSIHLLRDLKRRDAMARKLAELAATDGLTGLSNRWHFDETISSEWQRAQRTKSPLALLMIDADRFKTYNDRHGHQAGDCVLQTIGAAISGGIRRGTDLGARFGGDEFAVLLPETSLAGAAHVAEQIRKRFAADCSKQDLGEGAGISVGVACVVAIDSTPHTDLLEAADGALYRAKQLGRNRIELSEAESALPKHAPVQHAA